MVELILNTEETGRGRGNEIRKGVLGSVFWDGDWNVQVYQDRFCHD